MELYSERHGKRAPQNKTYDINTDMYALLLDCCLKHKNNLIHLFTSNSHHDFTDSDYISFDEKGFIRRIKMRIPALFRDCADNIIAPQQYEEYDQYALLDFIEFVAQNVKDISEEWNSGYHDFKRIECYDSSDVFKSFQKEINEIFFETGLLYELTDKKIVERIVENTPLTTDIEKSFETVDEQGTKDLLKDAIALYKTPSPAARQDSVEKIWDALERLKTYYKEMDKKDSVTKVIDNMASGNVAYIDMFNTEFNALTSIGNKFRIRHHETNKIDITDIRYYDYFFNRCLSTIALAVQYFS